MLQLRSLADRRACDALQYTLEAVRDHLTQWRWTVAKRSIRPAQVPRGTAASQLGDTRVVCAACLNEPFLHHLAASGPSRKTCIGCGRKRIGMLVEELVTRVEAMLGVYYHPAPNEPEGLEYLAYREGGYWEPPGERLCDLLAHDLGAQAPVVEAVCAGLAEREGGHRHVIEGGELYFRPEQHFVLRSLSPDPDQQEAFLAFQHRLQYEARLFHPESRALLASIFGGVDKLVTDSGAAVVVDVPPGHALGRLHRARVFQSDVELKRALVAPERELGPPPPARARARRMNAANVSVFYGASTSQAALAEVRPPAHSRVLVGEFEVVRSVRLLDVAALLAVLVEGSKFDPAHQILGRHAVFLQVVGRRISKPVLPDHQDGAYLVTQAIADFLAYECSPPFDGMIFPSTQSVDEGVNVVLFHGAARCEVPERPANVTMDADLESDTEDGPEPDYVVWCVSNDPRRATSPLEADATPDARPVTLRLRCETLAVHHILRTEVTTIPHPVRWHKYDASEPSEF